MDIILISHVFHVKIYILRCVPGWENAIVKMRLAKCIYQVEILDRWVIDEVLSGCSVPEMGTDFVMSGNSEVFHVKQDDWDEMGLARYMR